MSDYWEDQKKQPDVKTWLGNFSGSIHCDCGHGCQSWCLENRTKAYLLIKVLTDPKSTTKPDKIVKMHVDRVDKIWYRLTMWESQKFNRELRELEKNERKET